MKTLSLVILLFTRLALANDSIDDLQSINLRIKATETPAIAIHYPGYTIGGGAPPGLHLDDCLLLDIKESNVAITIDDKMKLAQKLTVIDNFFMNGTGELQPVVRGNSVVFHLKSLGTYVTRVMVKSKTSETLTDVVRTTLPLNSHSTAPPEFVGNLSPVSMLYIRGCRFF